MVDAGVIFPYVDFQAVQAGRRGVVMDCLLDVLRTGIDAATFDAGEGVVGQNLEPNRLAYLHYGMMKDSVRVVWQTVDVALFWLENLEYGVLRGVERVVLESFVQCLQVAFCMSVVRLYCAVVRLVSPSVDVRKAEVFNADYFVVYVVEPFHIY